MASFERISIKNLTKSFKNADGGKNTIFEKNLCIVGKMVYYD